MTTYAELLAAGRPASAALDIEIFSRLFATAVPSHVTGQTEVAERAHKISPQSARLDALYTNTGIERRYSVEPKGGISRRTPGGAHRTYEHNALDLLERVAVESVAEAGLHLHAIDTIVTNTITGLTIPFLLKRA